MKTIKNISSVDMKVPFDFFTYDLPKNKIVSVSDELAKFLEERWPLSFSFEVQVNRPVQEVVKNKSKAYIRPEIVKNNTNSMETEEAKAIPSFGGADQTPADGVTDGDGVAWYGEGLTIEGGSNGS